MDETCFQVPDQIDLKFQKFSYLGAIHVASSIKEPFDFAAYGMSGLAAMMCIHWINILSCLWFKTSDTHTQWCAFLWALPLSFVELKLKVAEFYIMNAQIDVLCKSCSGNVWLVWVLKPGQPPVCSGSLVYCICWLLQVLAMSYTDGILTGLVEVSPVLALAASAMPILG